ncbi:MAG: hypothetical protein GXP42_00780 [Chloroflexi bacterium]|nr:hypothetical protein [Chloroflexota bacterium]
MSRNPEAGYPLIDETLCALCRRCPAMNACKGRAILRFERDEAPYVDAARCQQCWVCLHECPYNAIVRVRI